MEYARTDARELEIHDFLRRYPAPVLVAREIKGGTLKRKSLLTGDETPKKVKVASTMVHFKPGELAFDLEDPDMLLDRRFARECFVLLKKRQAMRGTEPVQIGRTSKSDVVVNDFTVSTEHAHVTFDARLKKYVIVDHDSTNGTKVAGKRTGAHKEILLISGQKIHLGRIGFVFLEPVDFYEYLRGELRSQNIVQALLDQED